MKTKKLILGVTESDCHIVSNRIIEFLLKSKGYDVINLGACTSIHEFSEAYKNNPDVMAIIIGTLNGHGYEDLQGLKAAKKEDFITCPIILGGNLSVGSKKESDVEQRYYKLGIDYILKEINELSPLLETIMEKKHSHSLRNVKAYTHRKETFSQVAASACQA